MWALGQPAHIPDSLTAAEFPLTLTSSTSPPSAFRNGRTRSRTAWTLSLETILCASSTGGPTGPTIEEMASHVPEAECRIPVYVAVFRRLEPERSQTGADYSAPGGKNPRPIRRDIVIRRFGAGILEAHLPARAHGPADSDSRILASNGRVPKDRRGRGSLPTRRRDR